MKLNNSIKILNKEDKTYYGHHFKKGDRVVCINNEEIVFFYPAHDDELSEWNDCGQSLQLGEVYIVCNMDYTLRRPRILIRVTNSPYKEKDWFYPDRFMNMKLLRKEKLNTINIVAENG